MDPRSRYLRHHAQPFAKVPRRIKSTQTVCQGLLGRAWIRSINGELSLAEAAEYLNLWAATENIILTDRPDKTI